MRKTEPGYATASDFMYIECLRVPSPELKISLYSSVNDPELLSAPRIPCDGQSRLMASRAVTLWAPLNTQDSVLPLTSDRESDGVGQGLAGRVAVGGSRIIKTKQRTTHNTATFISDD